MHLLQRGGCVIYENDHLETWRNEKLLYAITSLSDHTAEKNELPVSIVH